MKRLVVLSGATGGIGKALLRLLENMPQWDCCAIARNPSDLSEFEKAKIFQLDFCTFDFQGFENFIRENCCEETQITFIQAAGTIAPVAHIEKYGVGDIDTSIAVNVSTQAQMIAALSRIGDTNQVKVRIVQFDSGAAYRPIDGWALYCAGKAYMSLFLQTLAEERKDMQIVLVDPGVVDTKMQQQIRAASKEDCCVVAQFQEYHKAGQLHTPEWVAQQIYEKYVANWNAQTLKEKL